MHPQFKSEDQAVLRSVLLATSQRGETGAARDDALRAYQALLDGGHSPHHRPAFAGDPMIHLAWLAQALAPYVPNGLA